MSKVFVIAEAGVNHNGDFELAKKLIDVASEAGANAVKFQTFKADKLVIKSAEKAEYQKELTGDQESQYEMIKKLELSYDNHHLLKDYCKSRNIMFLSTAFDLDSLDFLNDLGLPLFKVPSGELTNLPYLRKMASFNKEIVLSTGMATLDEVRDAVEVFRGCNFDLNKLTILHCSTEYPTPIENVNLTAMLTIQKELGVNIGYSDHTEGIEVPIAAVALGARIIEKHFTLDKNMDGPDHKASLNPLELKHMIKSIRNVEKCLGNGVKEPSQNELKNKDIARKSIVALQEINEGDVLTEENITIKRPGTGISPMKWDDYLGTKATKDFKKDDLII